MILNHRGDNHGAFPFPAVTQFSPSSMYGDHRAALDTIAAHHAAAAQHMNHSSRKTILSSFPFIIFILNSRINFNLAFWWIFLKID